MFRTATYKPAICECDVFREEGDHQNRNAFTILIFGIAIIFIVALFSSVIYFREVAEIKEFLYEPCNKTDILSVQQVKDLIENSKFWKGMTQTFLDTRKMMKEATASIGMLLGKEAMEEQEKKMENEFYKPVNDNYNKAQDNLKRQISERKNCEEENFQPYLFKAILRTISAMGLIGMALTFFWFIFLFIISTQFFKSKFTADEYFKVQNQTHKIFVAALIAMMAFAVAMYCRDFYVTVYENTFDNVLNNTQSSSRHPFLRPNPIPNESLAMTKQFMRACCSCNVFSTVQHLNTERLYASVWLISWILLFVHLSGLYVCFKSMESGDNQLLDNKNLYDPCNSTGIISFNELQKMNNTKKDLIKLNISLFEIENYYPSYTSNIQPIADSINKNITFIEKVLKSQKQKRQICYYSNLQGFAKFTAIKAIEFICVPLICIFISWYFTLFIILTHRFKSKFTEVSYKKLYQLISKTFNATLIVLFLISCSLCAVVTLTLLKDFEDYVK